MQYTAYVNLANFASVVFETSVHENLIFDVPINYRKEWILIPLFYLFLKFLMFIFERESVSKGGLEREGDAESEAGSRL